MSTRTLNKLACAVAADALGVDVSTVCAEITDDNGHLELGVSAPIRAQAPAQATETTQRIQARLVALTGCTVSRVTVRSTDAASGREY